MKTYFTTILFLALCWPAQRLSGQDSLRLSQFIAMAEARALRGYQAQIELEQAKLRYALAKANLLPQLSATANLPNYQRTVSEIVQPDGTIRFQPVRNNNSAIGLRLTQDIPLTGGTLFLQTNLQRFDNFESADQLYNGTPFRVGLFQPIFGFNASKWQQQLAPVQLEEAQKQFLADRAAIRTEATRLFFDYLYARTELNISSANQQSNQELYEIARERHRLGKISDSDLMQLQVNLLSAQRSYQNDLQNFRDQAARLRAYLGESPGFPLGNPVSPQPPKANTLSVEDAIARAWEARPEPSRLRRQLLEAEQDVAQAKGEGGFQASLTASLGFTRSAQEVAPIYQEPLQEQLVQVQLSVPILDWGAQRSRVRLSQAALELQQRQALQQEVNLEADIRQTHQRLASLQLEVGLAQELMGLAVQRFDIAQQTYRLGGMDITNLIISQQEKDLATRTYVYALGDSWQAWYDFQELTLNQ